MLHVEVSFGPFLKDGTDTEITRNARTGICVNVNRENHIISIYSVESGNSSIDELFIAIIMNWILSYCCVLVGDEDLIQILFVKDAHCET